MADNRQKQRWYDQKQQVATAIEMLLTLPEELQTIICRSVVLLANREFKAEEQLHNLKSLGTDKVLALFKSKNKKRHYDQNQTAHVALNYMGFLSEDNQQFMVVSITDMMGLVREYLQLCKTTEQSPEHVHIGALTDGYVTQGKEATDVILKAIEAELIHRVENKEITLVVDQGEAQRTEKNSLLIQQ